VFNIALYQPEIPPNTGNIIRLCANTGVCLHLIHPLGFDWHDARMKRAGLDYHEYAGVRHYKSLSAFLDAMADHTIYACTTKGSTFYHQVRYHQDDVLLMGPETRGLPDDYLNQVASSNRLRIPMRPDRRSYNLANATAIILMEALRQLQFPGCI
jgi:tRNA (cytidine/uridine-2'-O-)-methyltransferase